MLLAWQSILSLSVISSNSFSITPAMIVSLELLMTLSNGKIIRTISSKIIHLLRNYDCFYEPEKWLTDLLAKDRHKEWLIDNQ